MKIFAQNNHRQESSKSGCCLWCLWLQFDWLALRKISSCVSQTQPFACWPSIQTLLREWLHKCTSQLATLHLSCSWFSLTFREDSISCNKSRKLKIEHQVDINLVAGFCSWIVRLVQTFTEAVNMDKLLFEAWWVSIGFTCKDINLVQYIGWFPHRHGWSLNPCTCAQHASAQGGNSFSLCMRYNTRISCSIELIMWLSPLDHTHYCYDLCFLCRIGRKTSLPGKLSPVAGGLCGFPLPQGCICCSQWHKFICLPLVRVWVCEYLGIG